MLENIPGPYVDNGFHILGILYVRRRVSGTVEGETYAVDMVAHYAIFHREDDGRVTLFYGMANPCMVKASA